MRYLRTYKLFESKGLADFLNRYVNGTWTLNSEGLVDIKGNFYCIGKGIKTFEGIKFGKIGGKFDCSRNQLRSLEGAPKEVGGDFDCSRNQLQSLEGAPEKVGGSFNCGDNQLKSLEGSPQEIGDNFRCHSNQLKSLKGAPKKVGVIFYCYDNPLQSLDGAPSEYKTIWWSERGSNFIVPPFERAIEKESMLVYSIFNNPEAMDKLVDSIKKDLDNAPRILSIMRKNDPEFYERFKRRAEDMGVTIDTSADLGDLGF